MSDQVNDDFPPVLKVAQAAKYLQIGPKVVRELFFTGKLRGFTIGKSVRLDRESVIRFGRGEVSATMNQIGADRYGSLPQRRQRRPMGR